MKIEIVKKVFAQSPFGPINDPIDPALGGYGSTGAGLKNFITSALSAAVTIAGLAFFVYLLYGGLMYLTAAGDEKNLEKAKKTLSNGLIGLVIVAATWFIIRIVETVLKINILKFCFPGPGVTC